jgi:hypothetical protein
MNTKILVLFRFTNVMNKTTIILNLMHLSKKKQQVSIWKTKSSAPPAEPSISGACGRQQLLVRTSSGLKGDVAWASLRSTVEPCPGGAA